MRERPAQFIDGHGLLEAVDGLHSARARLPHRGDHRVEQPKLQRQEAAELEDCLVPTLVLQPLVKNAIRHGIAPRPSGGRLTVRAERASDRLVLTVQDDGIGADLAAVSSSRGTGLRTLAERLALDGALGGWMEVRRGKGEGFRVTVSLGGAGARW